jgi:hypothetical protein
MIPGEAHEGEDVGFGPIHQGGELGHFGPELMADLAPLGPSRLAILPDEGDGDEVASEYGVPSRSL